MMPERTRRGQTIAWAVLVAYFLVLVACSVLPRGSLGLPVTELPGTYRTAHAIVYAGLALLLCVALATDGASTFRRAALAAVISAGAGGIFELAQALVPWRKARWGDFAADLLGILLTCSAWLVWRAARARLRTQRKTAEGPVHSEG